MMRVLLSAIALVGPALTLPPTEVRVPTWLPVFDCSHVRPGTHIVIDGPNRGPLTILDCIGTDDARIRITHDGKSQLVISDVEGLVPRVLRHLLGDEITIRNDATESDQATLSRSSGDGGFIFECRTCIHVVIDGTGGWSGAPSGGCGINENAPGVTPYANQVCGIKVTTGTGGPSTHFAMRGLSTKFTVQGIEVDGNYPTASRGIGMQLNDHTHLAVDNPGFWREDILFQNNYIHDVVTEGMYIGPNIPQGDIPLRNIEIAYTWVDTNDREEGIQIKSAYEGDNLLHHNLSENVGQGTPGVAHGISCYESRCRAYNNRVRNVGGVGIQHFLQHLLSSTVAEAPFEAFNNVVSSPGTRGIVSNRSSSNQPALDATIHNNTIVDTGAQCILAEEGIARDNILADCGSSTVSGGISASNNWEGTAAEQNFVDAANDDYHLTETSPAVDQGTSNGPAVDIDGDSRPQGSGFDQGADEYTGASVSLGSALSGVWSLAA